MAQAASFEIPGKNVEDHDKMIKVLEKMLNVGISL